MATTKTTEIIEIKPIEIKKVQLKIVGDTPLITHAWSAKAKRQILEKELGATKVKAREPKNPLEDFCSSMYWLTPMPEEYTEAAVDEALKKARFGFPVTSLKQAAISTAYRLGWAKDKASLRPAFFLEPEFDGYYAGDLVIDYDHKKVDIVPNVWKPADLVEIHSDMPIMREDSVTVMNGAADLRYRGEFRNWTILLTMRYNANGQYTVEQLINMINAGGFGCGIGEWRTERDGISGAFHVEAI